MGLLERFLPSPASTTEHWRAPSPGMCRCEAHVEELLDREVPPADGSAAVTIAELLRSGALASVPAADQLFVTSVHTGERRGPFHWRVVPQGRLARFYDPAAPAGLDDAIFVQPGVESVLWLEEDALLAVGAPRLCLRGVQAAVVSALTNPRIRLLPASSG